MRTWTYRCIIGIISLCSINAQAEVRWPAPAWAPVPSVLQAGWDVSQLALLTEALDNYSTSAFLVIENGQVVVQYGAIDKPFPVQDIRISLLGLLYGVQTKAAPLELGTQLSSFQIKEKAPLTAEEQDVTLQKLLESDHHINRAGASDGQRKTTTSRLNNWTYSTWGFNVLGFILENTEQQPLAKLFTEKIAQPIGLEDFQPARDIASIVSNVSQYPAQTFQLSARDLARIGLLSLNHGEWNGQTLINPDWMIRSLRPYSHPVPSIMDGSNAGGFGYLWWVEFQGEHFPGVMVPKGTYSARGENGQYLVIMPACNLVIVHLAGAAEGVDSMSPTAFGGLLAMILRTSAR